MSQPRRHKVTKQFLKTKAILAHGYTTEMTLPGEPLIYSVKYSVGCRMKKADYFRNRKFNSLIKCYFKSYAFKLIPCVVIVTFYVTPTEGYDIKPADLRSEKVPALHSYELADYLLSFMEMIFRTLISTYRQLVKIDMQKFYSNNPRTVFQFMRWEHYVSFRDKDTAYTEGQKLRSPG